jgi:uncharacterized protein YbaA (DUF1428 family)
MTKYIDGFILPVPKKNMSAYRRMAGIMAKLTKKYGALEYYESVGDDLDPNMGGMKFTKFPTLAKAKPGETVVFSFVVYKSKKHRDQVNAKIMSDPLMNDPKIKDKPMPFDLKRMAYGGFKTIVEA